VGADGRQGEEVVGLADDEKSPGHGSLVDSVGGVVGDRAGVDDAFRARATAVAAIVAGFATGHSAAARMRNCRRGSRMEQNSRNQYSNTRLGEKCPSERLRAHCC